MTTALVSHPECVLHEIGANHPEQPARSKAVEDQLIVSGLMDHLQHVAAPLVQRLDLERVHTSRYVEALESAVPARGWLHLDPDTAMNPHTLTAARRAARALDVHALERVAIVDFDVHHGNGTEEIFCDDPRVLMVSTFQHPFYPYSGMEGQSDRMVNVPHIVQEARFVQRCKSAGCLRWRRSGRT